MTTNCDGLPRLFIKRPVVVEAVQWCPGIQVEGVMIREVPNRSVLALAYVTRDVEGRASEMPMYAGDWLVKGHFGDWYPVEREAFEATYQATQVGED